MNSRRNCEDFRYVHWVMVMWMLLIKISITKKVAFLKKHTLYYIGHIRGNHDEIKELKMTSSLWWNELDFIKLFLARIRVEKKIAEICISWKKDLLYWKQLRFMHKKLFKLLWWKVSWIVNAEIWTSKIAYHWKSVFWHM